MKSLGSLRFLVLAPLAIAACSTIGPRIDGSSDAAFERSHTAVVESLSPEDRLRLSLAELIILSPKGCLTAKPIPGQPLLSDTFGGQADVRSCRRELHGLTFKDIMSRAYPQGEPTGGGASGAT